MTSSRCFACIALGVLVSVGACEEKNSPGTTTRDSTPSTTRPDANRQDNSRPAPAPDNTVKNKPDATGETKTPLDQSQSSADIKTTADIRRAIMDDKGMSTNAQNCKIITDKSGMVTLRGVVNSQGEKDSIEAKAKVVAGAAKVDNQLEVKTN